MNPAVTKTTRPRALTMIEVIEPIRVMTASVLGGDGMRSYSDDLVGHLRMFSALCFYSSVAVVQKGWHVANGRLKKYIWP